MTALVTELKRYVFRCLSDIYNSEDPIVESTAWTLLSATTTERAFHELDPYT